MRHGPLTQRLHVHLDNRAAETLDIMAQRVLPYMQVGYETEYRPTRSDAARVAIEMLRQYLDAIDLDRKPPPAADIPGVVEQIFKMYVTHRKDDPA